MFKQFACFVGTVVIGRFVWNVVNDVAKKYNTQYLEKQRPETQTGFAKSTPPPTHPRNTVPLGFYQK